MQKNLTGPKTARTSKMPSPSLHPVRQPARNLRIRCGWFGRNGRCPHDSSYYYRIPELKHQYLACCHLHSMKLESNDTLEKEALTYEDFVTMGVMSE